MPNTPEHPVAIHRVARPDQGLLDDLRLYDSEAFGELGLRSSELAMLAEVGLVLLAHVGEEVIGGCQLLRMLEKPDLYYIVGLYVRPAWQGQGYGTVLLGAVIREAQAAGAAGLVLTVAPENERALALYRSVGFVPAELVADFYGSGQHRQLLRLHFAE